MVDSDVVAWSHLLTHVFVARVGPGDAKPAEMAMAVMTVPHISAPHGMCAANEPTNYIVFSHQASPRSLGEGGMELAHCWAAPLLQGSGYSVPKAGVGAAHPKSRTWCGTAAVAQNIPHCMANAISRHRISC